jgi:hypothetical protein
MVLWAIGFMAATLLVALRQIRTQGSLARGSHGNASAITDAA